MKQHIFVTAPPGVGKSTLIQRVLEQLQLLPAGTCGMHSSSSGRSTVPGDSSAPIATGFYTEEVRVGGERVGFDIVTLTGQRGPLARAGTAGRGAPTVGKYVVDVSSFEALALPAILPAESTKVVVIDEAGKMELFSAKCYPAVQTVLDDPQLLVLGSLPVPKYGRTVPQVEALKARSDIQIISVSKDNRDNLPVVAQEMRGTLQQLGLTLL